MKYLDEKVWANSVDTDPTAPTGAVWSGSTLFAILSVLLDLSKDSQTDLVTFYVKYMQSPNIFDIYGIILLTKCLKQNKKKTKKKKTIPTYPTLFFSNMFEFFFYLASYRGLSTRL